jgi:hypothetical protein
VTAWLAATTYAVPPLCAHFDGRALKKEECVAIPDDVGQKLLGTLVSGTKLSEMKLTLDSERKESGLDAAVFRATAKLLRSKDDDDIDESVALAGTLVVAKEGGFVLAIEMSGPATITGSVGKDDAKLELDGKGSMTIHFTARIE